MWVRQSLNHTEVTKQEKELHTHIAKLQRKKERKNNKIRTYMKAVIPVFRNLDPFYHKTTVQHVMRKDILYTPEQGRRSFAR